MAIALASLPLFHTLLCSQALGTHGGIVHILDLKGNRIKSYKPHQASVIDICMDVTADFVATASIDGELFLPQQHKLYINVIT
jgi:hypothetical protein